MLTFTISTSAAVIIGSATLAIVGLIFFVTGSVKRDRAEELAEAARNLYCSTDDRARDTWNYLGEIKNTVNELVKGKLFVPPTTKTKK